MRECGAASNTNQRRENPKSEASARVLEVLKGKLCKLPEQRFKKAAVATDVYMRGKLCERSKKVKSVSKSRKTEFQVELMAIYSLKSCSFALKSSDLKLFQSKQ